MGVFRFSAALIEWSESELNDVKRFCIQAYKNAWHLPQSTASAVFIFPKTHAGRQASVHDTGKMSWAAATRSIRECKMRIERIGGSRLDTDSEVWGLDRKTWELMWAGKAAMQKSISALRQAGYESISDLPRIQQSYREKVLVVILPVMRKCATSNGEQRVQVFIPVVQGFDALYAR